MLLIGGDTHRIRAVAAMVAVDEGNAVVLVRDPREACRQLERFSVDGAIFHYDASCTLDLDARMRMRDRRIPALWLMSSTRGSDEYPATPSNVCRLGEPFDVTMIAAYLRFASRQRIVCAASWYARARRFSPKQSEIFVGRALLPEQPLLALAHMLGMSQSTFHTQRRRLEEKCGEALDQAVRQATGHIGRGA
jgi:hypothetical protein